MRTEGLSDCSVLLCQSVKQRSIHGGFMHNASSVTLVSLHPIQHEVFFFAKRTFAVVPPLHPYLYVLYTLPPAESVLSLSQK